MKTIDQFTGKYEFLSNFYPCKIIYEEHEYPSSEHLYQALKAERDVDRKRIRLCATAAESKKLARKVQMRPDWEIVKIIIMEEVVRTKFAQNPKLASMLQATRGCKLVEGNWWGDLYWGVDEKTGEGFNNLGKILEKIRDEIDEVSETPLCK